MTPDVPQVEVAIVEMTNAFRATHRLGALRRSRQLDEIARSYARYLARTGTFSHTADGRQPADRAKIGGYRYCQFAENLALNYDSRGFRTRQLARDAVTGWENSPGHRRNMMSQHATEIGVGVAKDPRKSKYLSVQLFGRPEALQFSFRIRNAASKAVAYRLGKQAHDLPRRVEVTHTICRPEPLIFPSVRTRNGRVASKFAIRAGDLFVVRQGRNGTIIVDHRPHVN